MVDLLLLVAGLVGVWLAFRWTRPSTTYAALRGVVAFGGAFFIAHAQPSEAPLTDNFLSAAMRGRLAMPILFFGLWAILLFDRVLKSPEHDPDSLMNRSAKLALIVMLPMLVVAALQLLAWSGPQGKLVLDARALWIVGAAMGVALVLGFVWWRRPPYR